MCGDSDQRSGREAGEEWIRWGLHVVEKVVEKVGEWWGRVGDWDECFHNLQCPCCVLGLLSLLVFGVFFNCF